MIVDWLIVGCLTSKSKYFIHIRVWQLGMNETNGQRIGKKMLAFLAVNAPALFSKSTQGLF